MDRNKLTSVFVKKWVIANYEIFLNHEELEREAIINAKKLHDYLDWRCYVIEKYKTGLLTKAFVNSGNSVILINAGNDSLFNVELVDNFIGIPLKKSNAVTLLPNSKQQINFNDFESKDVNALQFKLLGEDIKLNFDHLKLPYLTLMNVFHDSVNVFRGYAPEKIITHLLILTSGDNQGFTSIIDYGDGSKKDTVYLNNGINSYIDIDKEHKYEQPGGYSIKISTINESGLKNDLEYSFEILNPIKTGLPFNKDLVLTPRTQIHFSADSMKCIYPDATLNYFWDFDYNGLDFHVDKIGKDVTWNYNINPSSFDSTNQIEYTVGLIVSLHRNSVTIKDSILQSFKLSNPVIANYSSSNSHKNVIIDVDSIPYSVDFNATKSFSYNKDSIHFAWSIDNSIVSYNKTMNYEFKTAGKYTIALQVDDGYYSRIKKDSFSLNFNINSNLVCKVSQVEYFFDKDLGYGKGIAVPIVFVNSVIKVKTTIDCSNLSTGLHRIYFRAQDDSLRWSIPQSQIIIVQAFNPNTTQITEAEYFFDQDPGYGNGIKMSVQAGNNVSISTLYNLKDITEGLHRVYFRAKDNLGNWSILQSQLVIVQQTASTNKKVIDAEYFFDSDPGVGNGIRLTVHSGDSILINTVENIQNISVGLHRLYFRVKGSSGIWGIPQSQIVIVQNTGNSSNLSKINYAEYFFDNDPGFRHATKINIVGTNYLLLNDTLAINQLTEGKHSICIRVCDESGRWSIPIIAQFEVEKDLTSGMNAFTANNETNFKIFGGKERITIITPKNDLNQMYHLKVYTLSGTLILEKDVVGPQKIIINKGFFVVDILDNFKKNKTTQKVLTY